MPLTTVTARKGNLVRQTDCDGIVNSANPQLIAGSGVCGAIYAAAGPRLEPVSRLLAPLQLGEAVVTPGFDLPCRLIIHTRGPRYHQDLDPPGNLARALRSAIMLADQNGLTRLAVPALSMGVYGYPPAEAVPILVSTALALVASLQHLQEIRFVVVSDELLQLFTEQIAASV
jgi:O-acetyl-ADP-ribose deacetylase (regulator of RNase III)